MIYPDGYVIGIMGASKHFTVGEIQSHSKNGEGENGYYINWPSLGYTQWHPQMFVEFCDMQYRDKVRDIQLDKILDR
jgi:hypothetical protein